MLNEPFRDCEFSISPSGVEKFPVRRPRRPGERRTAVSEMHVAGPPASPAFDTEVEREVAAGAADRLRGDLVGDDVDETADGAGAVEQCGGTAHHLDPFGAMRGSA